MNSAFYRSCQAILLLYLFFTLAGCATNAPIVPSLAPAMHTPGEFSDDEQVAVIEDPWEGFNRRMYNFNYYFDEYFFLPVVSGYEFVTPVFVQKGISNFFSNIGEVRTLYNSVFQLKGKKSMVTLGRFVANSTLGVGGLFDVATHFGLRRQVEDFGQTLGYWGAKSGPYLVLPALGPSTVRGTGGLAVDGGIRYAAVNAIDPFGCTENGDAIMAGVSTLEAVDMRHRIKFRYYETHYPFEYYMVRFLYQQSQELQIMK